MNQCLFYHSKIPLNIFLNTSSPCFCHLLAVIRVICQLPFVGFYLCHLSSIIFSIFKSLFFLVMLEYQFLLKHLLPLPLATRHSFLSLSMCCFRSLLTLTLSSCLSISYFNFFQQYSIPSVYKVRFLWDYHLQTYSFHFKYLDTEVGGVCIMDRKWILRHPERGRQEKNTAHQADFCLV